MKNLIQLFATLLLISLLQTSFAQNNTLKLRSGDLQLTAIDSQSKIADVISQNPSNGGYYLIQFEEIPTQAEQNALSSNGIALLEYIPEYAFLANLNQLSTNLVLADLGIRNIEAWKKQYKTSTFFDLSGAPDHVYANESDVRLLIDRQLDVDPANFISLLEQNNVNIEDYGSSDENLNIRISQDQFDWLADLPEIKFIDYAPAPPEPEDTRARSLHRLNLLDSDDPMGRKLNGDSVSIAIADNGLGSHIDRKGRVTMHTTVNNGTHGDMTTGIAVGAGNLNPNNAGMATHSYLHYYNIGGYPQVVQAVNNLNINGVVITSTSFSQGCNNYTSDTRAIDLQVNANDELLHVFSAGNSASSNCGYGAGTPWGNITGGYKQGKAVIATGNLDYRGFLTPSSSRGPASDGRIKPDICSNGTNQISTDPNNGYSPGGGTSAAAPGIAGISALLYQGYRELNNNANPPSGLIKSSMLNTARDIGNAGPDFFYGWGRVNAHRAMLLLEDNRYLNANISQNNTNTHNITINQDLEELKVMIYWTDVAGSTVASKALVNDIDIRVVTPNNDTIFPYILNSTPNAALLSLPATRGVDDLNNMEQVAIDTASAGTYTVLVDGTAIPSGPQSYHLLWETVSDSIAVTYPAGGESFVPGTSETIRWDAVEGSGNFTVEYSSNNGTSWSQIATVGANNRYVNWNVPNLNSGDMLVRVRRNGITGVSSSNFSVLRTPPNVTVNFVCPDSVQIGWGSVNGATSYDVYLLGATHMDSIGSSTSNSLTLYNLNTTQENWVAVRARSNNAIGERSVAVQIPQNTFNCPLSYDLSITQINSPSANYIPGCGGGKQAVRVTINNAGDSVLNNVPVKLRAGTTVYYDTITGPLAPSSFQFFTFKDSLSLGTGTVTISAIGDLATDQNELNDSVASDVQVIPATVFTVPYGNDFENFNSCSTNNDCGATTCTLNGGWTNVSNNIDEFDMRVDFGGTPSNGTGPSVDENPGTGTGNYLYSEASNNCYGQTSVVLTPCFDLSGTIQPEFNFAYHMLGTAMGVIRVDIFANGAWNDNIITPLFGNVGNFWNRENIDLSNYIGQTVTLRFRFQTGSSWASDMAIDDVNVIDQGVGLSEIKTDEYRLFPNPSEGQFRIQLTEGEIGELRVFDLQGRNIYRSRLNTNYGEIDLSGFDKGIYIIEFKDGEVREKIMVN